jgi:glycosyltransferase involved in cell wall biosynthesis
VNSPVRVAFFTDSFHDVNGVAHTSRQLEYFARRRQLPILSVHAGPRTEERIEGSCHTVEFGRSRSRIPLDEGLAFDPWFFRFWHRGVNAIHRFRPNVVHVTGPGDVGALGALLAWRKGIPLVASWHTNLHEYASTRFPIKAGRPWIQERSLDTLMFFYSTAKVCLAPNEELRQLIERRAKVQTFLMERGIDTEQFSPTHRPASRDESVVLGYVGRLRPEKNVRLLAKVETALQQAGLTNYRFLIVGEGSEREWLQANMTNAEFPGVLRGEPLARAYASMDLFLFPSWTDTYGNVIAEALASGVPAVVTAGGGPKFLVTEGETGAVGTTEEEFAAKTVELVRNPQRIAAMHAPARNWALGRTWDSVFERVWRAYELASGVSMAPCPRPFATAF